ncbi:MULTISPECIES: MFS transporter [Actinosynnema]|uniref:MFS transporter n=1 Tax=Actinosynnema TaxID=40566 RepID=UPI0020A5F873|nr:MFS transporter [Actinosynnema pretiosum]MCP2097792.1 putative arabinose efflux permease, MFS family [Actinosynnema pretiosum]
MSAPSDDAQPRFRDALRRLPPVVWTLSLGILVNRIGNFLPVFMVLYLTGRGFSPGAAGLVLGAAGLGNVLGNTLGGVLADRLGRRWTIVLSMVCAAGLTASIPLFDTLPLLIVMAFLTGTAAQLYRPAAAAVLVDASGSPQERLAAFAVFRFAINIGAALGAALGGALATVSYPGLFLGNAAACLLFAGVAAVLLRDRPRGDADGGTGEVEPKVGYREALADRALLRFLVMAVLAEFIYVQSTVGLPLHVSDAGMSPASFGLLISVNGVLVLLFELPITSAVSRRTPHLVLLWGNLATGVGLALTGVSANMSWLIATVVLWTLGEMLYASVAAAHLGGLAPPALVGRYQGLYGAAITFGTGVGPLVGGLAYAVDPWALWALCAVGGVVSGVLCLPSRGGKRVAAEEPASPTAP